MMLSLIEPEVTGISQHCQKGVMGCNILGDHSQELGVMGMQK